MLNRIEELKIKSTERAEYYTKLDFVTLAAEFTALVNILSEMEDIVRERDELKTQVGHLQSTINQARLDSLDIPEGAELKAGKILQAMRAFEENEEEKINEV